MKAEQNREFPFHRIGCFATPSSPLLAQGTAAPLRGFICRLALTLVALLLLIPSTASAKQVRLPAGTFGAATSAVPNPYPISNFTSFDAVDEKSHDVYVADSANNRIEKFDSFGHFLLMFGKEVNETAVEEARPETERNVCPAPGHPVDVCQPGVSSPAPGGFETGFFGVAGQLQVAVDNSKGPSAGDVYVAEDGKAHNDVQLPVVTATGGTFKLTFEGDTTAPIAYDAPASEGEGEGSVEAALQALPTVGAGNLSVTKTEAPTSEGLHTVFSVEFKGALAATNVPSLIADPSGLSPGAKMAIESGASGAGGASPTVSKFDPRRVTTISQLG